MSEVSYAEDKDAMAVVRKESHVSEAMQRLSYLTDRLDKATAVLRERLEDYLDPREDVNPQSDVSNVKEVTPIRAAHANGLHAIADRLTSTEARLEHLADRFQG